MLVLPPLPLYALTVAGIIVSSTAVYYFAEAMRFDGSSSAATAPQVARLRALMTRRELPIVIAWSFFPIAPTDLVCYVCGALKVDLRKCLLGGNHRRGRDLRDLHLFGRAGAGLVALTFSVAARIRR